MASRKADSVHAGNNASCPSSNGNATAQERFSTCSIGAIETAINAHRTDDDDDEDIG